LGLSYTHSLSLKKIKKDDYLLSYEILVLSNEERKERHKIQERERRKRPEVKAKSRKYLAIPEVSAKAKELKKFTG